VISKFESGFFLVIDQNVFEMTEKLSHFGQIVCKYRLMNSILLW